MRKAKAFIQKARRKSSSNTEPTDHGAFFADGVEVSGDEDVFSTYTSRRRSISSISRSRRIKTSSHGAPSSNNSSLVRGRRPVVPPKPPVKINPVTSRQWRTLEQPRPRHGDQGKLLVGGSLDRGIRVTRSSNLAPYRRSIRGTGGVKRHWHYEYSSPILSEISQQQNTDSKMLLHQPQSKEEGTTMGSVPEVGLRGGVRGEERGHPSNPPVLEGATSRPDTQPRERVCSITTLSSETIVDSTRSTFSLLPVFASMDRRKHRTKSPPCRPVSFNCVLEIISIMILNKCLNDMEIYTLIIGAGQTTDQ
eukprot:sb/3467184/